MLLLAGKPSHNLVSAGTSEVADGRAPNARDIVPLQLQLLVVCRGGVSDIL
ncbi:unnamed protein product [Acanthoscelides obtectus]|uniref:Uncharacterized protein n=1 Tax=Acanthoscelides obtectus TaxID=200917 RepID=A0A9P0KH94_ACAOB|nr:unnamed protein product [Acanthoscelides obtectus]CAK1685452.1 hypothetical protein AOBTE_LOCUS35416 [Acanthoscelides obtectus]